MTRNAQTRVAVAANSTKVEDVKAKNVDPGMFEELLRQYANTGEKLLDAMGVMSWKRTLVALITYAAGAAATWYISSKLVELVMVGAVTLGAPMFLSIAIAIIGVLLLAYYGHKLSCRLAGSVLTGEADARAVAAYDATKNMFKRLNPFGARTVKAAS